MFLAIYPIMSQYISFLSAGQSHKIMNCWVPSMVLPKILVFPMVFPEI